MNPRHGDIPDRFEILETLVDTEAEVQYRAKDTTLLREVILKRPGPAMSQLLRESGDQERALRESRALARIQHKGVVRLLDVIDTDAGPLMVMEPIPGRTLRKHLQEVERCSPEEVRRLGVEIASALEAVHATGAVHRGLSEDNIVIRPDGSACLAGFLFAKFPKAAMNLSSIIYRSDTGDSSESPKATPVLPDHPAPEQIMGQVADARSDLFGLGCVLYRMLTGKPAFGSLVADGWSPPEDVRKLAPETPGALADAIMKCLSRSPLARFQTASELRSALEAPSTGRSRFGPARVSGIAAGLIVALAAGLYATLGGEDPQDPSPRERGRPAVAIEAGRTGPARGRYAPRFASSRALVIGIGEVYGRRGFARLSNAERDAEDVARALESLGDDWQVERLIGESATRAAILQAFSRLERAEPDDRILIYYAGHGEPHSVAGEVGYLIPADAVPEQEDPGRTNWISFHEVDTMFDKTRAKHMLMLMDCCYAGRMGAMRGNAPSDFDAQYLSQRAQQVIAAAQKDERAGDGAAGGNSPFAEGFLLALRSAAENGETLVGSKLFTMIESHMREVGAPSHPVQAFGSQNEGQFVLLLGE